MVVVLELLLLIIRKSNSYHYKPYPLPSPKQLPEKSLPRARCAVERLGTELEAKAGTLHLLVMAEVPAAEVPQAACLACLCRSNRHDVDLFAPAHAAHTYGTWLRARHCRKRNLSSPHAPGMLLDGEVDLESNYTRVKQLGTGMRSMKSLGDMLHMRKPVHAMSQHIRCFVHERLVAWLKRVLPLSLYP